MSAQDPTDQIPPMDQPPLEEAPPAAEELPVDAERGQRGPASGQTGPEQTGVDDAAPGAPAGDATIAREGFAAQGNQQAAGNRSADGQEMLGAGTGPTDGPIKDPEQWVTGDEPMTDSQKSYLDTLARQAGEQLPADLTKAEASEHIDRLQEQTGRGQQQG